MDPHCRGRENRGMEPMGKMQDKDAERAFFDELAGTGESFKPKPEEEYDLVFRELGLDGSLEGLTALEAGCATGEFGVRMARRGARVHGIDISPGMIALNCRLNANVSGYSCDVGDLEDPGLFNAGSFDIAVSFNVLHHFPDCGRVIDNLALWLRDGGRVHAEEPNGGNLTNRISKAGRAAVKALFPALLLEKKLSSENEEHDYSMAEYDELFKRRGFRCVHRASIVSVGRPTINGFNITSLISLVKWLLYRIAGALTLDPMKKGNYLVFTMEKTGTDSNA